MARVHGMRLAALAGLLAIAGCSDAPPVAPDAVMPDAGCDCDDGLFCNGLESCGVGTCVAGTPPCDTPEDCDEAADRCTPPCTDADDDGACAEDDCDDADPARAPGNVEECDADDVDEDCDPATYGARDVDDDGHDDDACCNADGAATVCGTDCNDARRGSNPDATETCNEFDDDCDGAVDEGVTTTFYRDLDGDDFGLLATTIEACEAPPGYSVGAGDCDDSRASINPSTPEDCNGLDENCDGIVDNRLPPLSPCTCVDGSILFCGEPDGMGSFLETGECEIGRATCTAGSWGPCTGAVHPRDEICDTLDQDCDGNVDEGAQTVYRRDSDGDGFGVDCGTTCTADQQRLACSLPAGFALRSDDCDDTRAGRYPGAIESCNGMDEDCDPAIDEGAQNRYFRDADSDGYGCGASCPGGPLTMFACTTPSGYVLDGTDCREGTGGAMHHPGAPELCDRIDNNCNGTVDDRVDASGAPMPCPCTSGMTQSCSTDVGECTVGSQTCTTSGTWGTCSGVLPTAEICDGLDTDCDGVLDGPGEDDDRDGHADACAGARASDCNDTCATIYNGAPERCDHLRQNCTSSQPDVGVDVSCSNSRPMTAASWGCYADVGGIVGCSSLVFGSTMEIQSGRRGDEAVGIYTPSSVDVGSSLTLRATLDVSSASGIPLGEGYALIVTDSPTWGYAGSDLAIPYSTTDVGLAFVFDYQPAPEIRIERIDYGPTTRVLARTPLPAACRSIGTHTHSVEARMSASSGTVSFTFSTPDTTGCTSSYSVSTTSATARWTEDFWRLGSHTTTCTPSFPRFRFGISASSGTAGRARMRLTTFQIDRGGVGSGWAGSNACDPCAPW